MNVNKSKRNQNCEDQQRNIDQLQYIQRLELKIKELQSSVSVLKQRDHLLSTSVANHGQSDTYSGTDMDSAHPEQRPKCSHSGQNPHPVENLHIQSMDMSIRQLETTMFQNLYLMTMGGSQTNLQIQQQAGLINNLQTQQMNLMYSMLTQRPAYGHGGVNPHYFPQNPNCFYPNLSIPVNAPYSMPYNIPQAQFQVPPFFNASIPPPNLCFPPTDVRQVPAGSHLQNQIPPPTQQINQAYNTYGSNPGVYQPANLLTRHVDLPASPVPVNHDTEQNPTYKNSLTQEQVCHIPKDAGLRQPNKEPSSETDDCRNVISVEKNKKSSASATPSQGCLITCTKNG